MQNLATVFIGAFKDDSLVKSKEITDKITGEIKNLHTILVTSSTIGGGSILSTKRRVGFVTVEDDVYRQLQPHLKLGNKFPVEGKLQIIETLNPYVNSKGEPQDAKINPKTGARILHKGLPVYRNTVFTQNLDAKDLFLQTDASATTVAPAVEKAAKE